MIKLILFIHHDSGSEGKTFKRSMDQLDIQADIMLIQDFKTLEMHLIKPPDFVLSELFILLADSNNHLDHLFNFIELLKDKRLLLILPDNQPETISKAHKFWPRFFTYINHNYDDLCSVIKQIENKRR